MNKDNAAKTKRTAREEGDPASDGRLYSHKSKLRDPSWWMVGVALGVGVITFLQFRVAERTLTVAYRAYVTASARVLPARPTGGGGGREVILGEPKKPFQVGDIPYVTVEFVNRGATPALSAADSVSIALADRMPFEIKEVEIDSTRPPGSLQSVMTLAKDATAYLGAELGTALTAEQIRAIDDSRLFLVAFGISEYSDVFNAKHKTEFCFVYLPAVRGMGICPHHNTMS